MTQPDPDSSPEYNPYELFQEELDLDEFDLEPTSAPKPMAPPQGPAEATFTTQDEDRLYTDELIRQNEMASRSLFLSVLAAAAISVGIGLWYLLSQKPAPTPQPVAPLPVPEQPVLTPPGLDTPVLPSVPAPSNQLPSLPPSDSVNVPGSVPNNVPGSVPTSNPTLPSQASPSKGVVPPPPPSAPTQPQNSNR